MLWYKQIRLKGYICIYQYPTAMRALRFSRVLAFFLCATLATVSCEEIFGGPDDPYNPGGTPSTPGNNNKPCYTISITPSGIINFPASGGTVYLGVKTNAETFGATFPKRDWLKLAYSKDKTGIDATIAANDSGASREFQITVYALNKGSDEHLAEIVLNCVQPSFNLKAARYGNSEQFQTDIDAIVTYACDLRALRWCYFRLSSNGFENGEVFCAKPADLDKDYATAEAQYFDVILSHILENEEAYEAAMQHFDETNVFTSPTTKGYRADTFDFGLACKKTQTMGRQSVMAVLRAGGYATDSKKLEQLYNTLPAELRRGYSSYTTFWNRFSAGDIDERANQIFVNLYTFDPVDFGETARDIGITPGKNIAIAGADLIQKGYNVVLDACPFSDAIGYGKDAFNSIQATNDLVVKGDVKGFMQNASNILINYGRDLSQVYDKMQSAEVIYWAAGDEFWNEWGKDVASILINDFCFSDDFTDTYDKFLTHKGELIPNVVMTKDANGEEIALVIMVDSETGQMTIGYVTDKDGNIIANPKLPGLKYVTVLNKRDGSRITKPVQVEDGEEPTYVEVDYNQEVLSENPSDGYISMSPAKLEIPVAGGEYKATIISNYLYYDIDKQNSTGLDWISARVPDDVNLVYVTAPTNNTGQERTGKLAVIAKDSKGKKLNTTYLTVVQAAETQYEVWITADPATLEFSKDGGKLETVIDWYPSIKQLGAAPGKNLNGWADYEWVRTDDGWKIVVECNPNDTGAERSGTITVYGGFTKDDLDNAMNGNINPESAASTTVLIKQAAAGGGQGDVAIAYASVQVSLNDVVISRSSTEASHNYNGPGYFGWDTSNNNSYFKSNPNVFSVRTTSTGFTLIATYDHTEDAGYYQGWEWTNARMKGTITIAVSASDINDPKTYIIESIQVSDVYREYPTQHNTGDYREITNTINIKGNIPFKDQNRTNHYYTYRISGDAVTSEVVKQARKYYEWHDEKAHETGHDEDVVQSVNISSSNAISVNLYEKQ